jgi:hypothetical protein
MILNLNFMHFCFLIFFFLIKKFFFNEKNTLYIQKDIRMYKAILADKPRENKNYADETSYPYKSKVYHVNPRPFPIPWKGSTQSKLTDQRLIIVEGPSLPSSHLVKQMCPDGKNKAFLERVSASLFSSL